MKTTIGTIFLSTAASAGFQEHRNARRLGDEIQGFRSIVVNANSEGMVVIMKKKPKRVRRQGFWDRWQLAAEAFSANFTSIHIERIGELMRPSLICKVIVLLNLTSSPLSAQECPILHSGYDGEYQADNICDAIQSFNRNGVPGVIADDCNDDDCCDDDDPTWFPKTHYSAIISINSYGFSATRLDENEASHLIDSLEYADLLNDNAGYDYGRQIPSFDGGYMHNIPDEMRDFTRRYDWVDRSIQRGNLVYYYLRN